MIANISNWGIGDVSIYMSPANTFKPDSAIKSKLFCTLFIVNIVKKPLYKDKIQVYNERSLGDMRRVGW